MNKAIKYKIVAYVVVFFLLLLMPQGIYKTSQIQKIAIVSGIGIDRNADELEVSVSILVPKPSSNYSPKQVVSSSKGKTICDAIDSIELKIGKELGLAHCYIIVLGDDFVQKDISKDLDYLMRSNIMGNNSAILHTDKKAKEILEANSIQSEQNINNLQNIAKYNQEHYHSSNTNLINFFNDYLDCHRSSIMGSITLEEKQSLPQGEQNTQNSSSTQQQNSQPQGEKNISNNGEAIVIKNGVKIAKLTKEEIGYFGWLDTKSQNGYLEIDDFFDEKLKNAKITLKLKHEKANFDASLNSQTPIIKASISFECFVENIIDDDGYKKSIHDYILTPAFKEKIKEKIDDQIDKALFLSKEYNFDTIGIYDIFNKKYGKKWKEYLSTLDNPDDYIQQLIITTSVSMESKF